MCVRVKPTFCRRERDWVLGEFKAGRSPILIATDVASRGLGMFLFFSPSAPTGIRACEREQHARFDSDFECFSYRGHV